ncbi:hypothetical protein GCM10027194_15020 [Thalassiella azotivora]
MALALTVALLAYLVLLGARGVVLIGTGEWTAVLLGVGVLVLPFVAAWGAWRELRFGAATERLARELDAQGGLPVDDLPRTPGGRVVRGAADAAFERYLAETQAAPRDWRAWFRLSCAYDAAGDRKRARAAMRHALELHGGPGAGDPTA